MSNGINLAYPEIVVTKEPPAIGVVLFFFGLSVLSAMCPVV
jgi:hypothetical protein